MNYVGIESAQDAHHPRPRNSQWQRGDLREHPGRHPMNANAVVNPVSGFLTTRCIRRDDHGFVARAAEMLDHPKY
jgi:hypothetical protein